MTRLRRSAPIFRRSCAHHLRKSGQQRYWNGESWTENFAPGGPPVIQPAAARKNWFLRAQGHYRSWGCPVASDVRGHR